MVQMKVVIKQRLGLPHGLYIPHGSDESNQIKNKNENKKRLYIPHGSDESREAL